jgi:hypothetical protein
MTYDFRAKLKPIIDRKVDEGTMEPGLIPLWCKSYDPELNITVEWMEQVIAERKRHNETVVPPNNDAVFVEGGK